MFSPLRYPGSKRRLAAYIEKLLRLNNLEPSLFVEPFAGGASVALNLMENGTVDQVILVEKDPLVASFWQIVFSKNDDDVAWLIDQVRTIEVTVERWGEYKGTVPDDLRQQALACLFLNRTSFSGILAPSSGPLGGKAQKSQYKIDCRFPRDTLVHRIEQATAYRERVLAVWHKDWREALEDIEEMPVPGDIIYYLDPPFFEKADRLYTHYFQDDDHKALRDAVLKLEDPWILSYDYCSQVEALYGNGAGTHVELLYSANGGNRKAREVILTNLDILPDETRLWKTDGQRKESRTID